MVKSRELVVALPPTFSTMSTTQAWALYAASARAEDLDINLTYLVTK
jgi:hypothetical protein